MSIGVRLLLASLLAPAVLAGCGAFGVHVVDDSPATTFARRVSSTDKPDHDLEGVVRTHPRTPVDREDAVVVTRVSATEMTVIGPFEPAISIPMTVEECRALAVKRATSGRLIDDEWRSVANTADRYWCLDRHPFEVHQRLLMLRKEQRANELAGDAVQLLCRIQEGYETAALLDEALVEVDAAIADVRTLRQRGLQLPVEPGEFDRLRIALVDRRHVLDDSILHGQAELGYLVGMDAAAGPPIQPIVEPPMMGPIPDRDAAIALGLSRRADLRLIRLVLVELTPGTLPAARGVLQHYDPVLGTATGTNSTVGLILSIVHGSQPELDIRCRQLKILLADRSRFNAGEIAHCVEAVELAVRQVELAQETVASREGQLDELLQRRRGGEKSAFDVSQARLDLVDSRIALVQKLGALHVAWLKLDQAQGMLSRSSPSHDSTPVEAPPPPTELPAVEPSSTIHPIAGVAHVEKGLIPRTVASTRNALSPHEITSEVSRTEQPQTPPASPKHRLWIHRVE